MLKIHRILNGVFMKILGLALGTLLGASAMAGGKLPSSVALRVSGSVHAAFLGVLQTVKRPKTAGSYLGIGGNLTGVFDGKSNGMGFGAVAAIDLDKVKDKSKRIAEAYVFINGSIGSVYAGALEGPLTTLMHDATDVIGGSKGPLGWITRTVELPVGVNSYLGLRLSDTNKIAFTTASMKGLILGVSFSPDSQEPGRFPRAITENGKEFERKITHRNVIEIAANFTKTFNGKTIGVFVGGAMGQVLPEQKGLKAPDKAPSYFDISAFQCGALFDVGNVRFAGGYFNWGKSCVRKGTGFTAPQGWNVGTGVTCGPFLFSLSYFYTWREVEGGQATSHMIPVAVDYLLAPGCTVYAEVDFVSAKSTKKHTGPEGKRDFKLDPWDKDGFTTDNGGLVSTNAQVFTVGMKIQC